jgi:hypothetical protein
MTLEPLVVAVATWVTLLVRVLAAAAERPPSPKVE